MEGENSGGALPAWVNCARLQFDRGSLFLSQICGLLEPVIDKRFFSSVFSLDEANSAATSVESVDPSVPPRTPKKRGRKQVVVLPSVVSRPTRSTVQSGGFQTGAQDRKSVV